MAVGAAILNGLYGDTGAYFGILGRGQYGIGTQTIPPSAATAILFHEYEDKHWIVIYAKKGRSRVALYDGIGENGSFGPAHLARLHVWQATLPAMLREDAWFPRELELRDEGIYTFDDADLSGPCSLWWAEFRACGWHMEHSDMSHIDAGLCWFPTTHNPDYHAIPGLVSDIGWEEVVRVRFKEVAMRGRVCMPSMPYTHDH